LTNPLLFPNLPLKARLLQGRVPLEGEAELSGRSSGLEGVVLEVGEAVLLLDLGVEEGKGGPRPRAKVGRQLIRIRRLRLRIPQEMVRLAQGKEVVQRKVAHRVQMRGF
jgi:hypothetical protein